MLYIPYYFHAAMAKADDDGEDDDGSGEVVQVWLCPHCSTEITDVWHGSSLYPPPPKGRVCPQTGKDVIDPETDEQEV